MSTQFRLRAGQTIGSEHRFKLMNCQDSHAAIHQDDLVVGVVCDGCSEGRHSEVGAALIARFTAQRAYDWLKQGVAIDVIPDVLYADVINYMRQLVAASHPDDRIGFVRDYLLCTIIGFVARGNEIALFSAGDGLVMVDQQVMAIEQHNRPHYAAYQLVDRQYLAVEQLDKGFQRHVIAPDWCRIAISTDGFVPDLLPQVWHSNHPRHLQRRLNIWTDERRFVDDVAIITLERL